MANNIEFPTWGELYEYLKMLSCVDDPRLGNKILVRELDGEYYPAEFLEFSFPDDEIIEDETIVLQTYDWDAKIREIQENELEGGE